MQCIYIIKLIVIITELAVELIKILLKDYIGTLENRYNIEENQDPFVTLGNIAESRQCKTKGDQLDLEKAAKLLIDDYRSGKLGRITLEMPPK